jgi:hypothetical protein
MPLRPYELALCATRSALELERRIDGEPADLPHTLALALYLDTRGPRDERVTFALYRTVRASDPSFTSEKTTADELNKRVAFITQELLFLSQRGYKVNRNEIASLLDFVLMFSDEVAHALRHIGPRRSPK